MRNSRYKKLPGVDHQVIYQETCGREKENIYKKKL